MGKRGAFFFPRAPLIGVLEPGEPPPGVWEAEGSIEQSLEEHVQKPEPSFPSVEWNTPPPLKGNRKLRNRVKTIGNPYLPDP